MPNAVEALALDERLVKQRLKHYRAALVLTDRLRDPKHRAYLRNSVFFQTFGWVSGRCVVDEPGYRDTQRGILKRAIARLEAHLAG